MEIELTQTRRLSEPAPRTETQRKKVFVALPIYTSPDPFFFQCCMHLAQSTARGDLYGEIRMRIGDSAIGRSRNALTREFLEGDCTHLLFIDSDLIFSMDHIRRIMSHDEDIVGGCYCKKQEGPPQLVLNTCFEPREALPNGLLEVRYIGTGFIRVSRKVFEAIIDKFGHELVYSLDHARHVSEYDFWRFGVYTYPDGYKRYLSEDWFLSQMALDCGFKVWADTGVVLKHRGMVDYPLSYQEKVLFGHEVSNTEVVSAVPNSNDHA